MYEHTNEQRERKTRRIQKRLEGAASDADFEEVFIKQEKEEECEDFHRRSPRPVPHAPVADFKLVVDKNLLSNMKESIKLKSDKEVYTIRMEWDNNKALQLIEEFQKRDILWNPKHAAFYNMNKKEDAWMSLSQAMHCSVEEVKKKMGSLKGSFRRERNRVRRTRGRHNAYRSKWFAYSSLKFLVGRRPRTESDEESNAIDPTDEALEDPEEDMEHVGHNSEDDVVKSEIEFIEQLGMPDGNAMVFSSRTQEPKIEFVSPKRPAAKRRWRKADDCRIAKTYKTIAKDEFSTYGEHIANKLRKLDHISCAVIQHKINTLLFEAEMKKYKRVSRLNVLNSPNSVMSETSQCSTSSNPETSAATDASVINPEISELIDSFMPNCDDN